MGGETSADKCAVDSDGNALDSLLSTAREAKAVKRLLKNAQ